MGILDALLRWNRDDPPDDRERGRNDVVYAEQGNRNPFIDNPRFACLAWGHEWEADACGWRIHLPFVSSEKVIR